MELIYVFDENSEFQKKLKEVYKKTKDLTIPLRLIATSWFRGNNSIFDENRAGPGRYADLSQKPFFAKWERKGSDLRKFYPGGYKEYKRAKYGFAYPILKARGALQASITDPADVNSINLIINKSTLVLGTKVKYAIYHQSQKPRGTGKTGRAMPYRPFLFVGVEQIAPNDIKNNRLNTWMQILDSYFTQITDFKATKRKPRKGK